MPCDSYHVRAFLTLLSHQVNVFLGHDNKVKLGDLGVSRILDKDDDMAMSRVGTPLYLAPELIKRQVSVKSSHQ